MHASLKTEFEFDGKAVDFEPFFRFYDYAWFRNFKRELEGFGAQACKRLIVAMPAAGSQPQVAIAALIEWHRLTGIPVTVVTMHLMTNWNPWLRDEDDFEIFSGFGSPPQRSMEECPEHLKAKKIRRIDTGFEELGGIYEEMYPHAIVTNVAYESRFIDGEERYSMSFSADFALQLITDPRLKANRPIPTLAVRSKSLKWMYGNEIPANRFYNFVDWEMELHDAPPPKKDEVSEQIGRNVFNVIEQTWKFRNAERIKKGKTPKGLTLQVGIGRIATTIFRMIGDFEKATGEIIVRKLQTEVTGDGVERLAPEKPIDCTIVLGGKAVREAMTDKPHRRVRPVEETNGHATAAKEDLLCVNWVMQASLRGGGASEVGGQDYGGSGGAPNFAGNSKIDAIFGLPSRRWNKTTKRWESNIVLDFDPASTVVAIPANRIKAYVTEHGIAYLRPYYMDNGELWVPTREAVAKAMIAIADPDFREELTRQAIEKGLIDQDLTKQSLVA